MDKCLLKPVRIGRIGMIGITPKCLKNLPELSELAEFKTSLFNVKFSCQSCQNWLEVLPILTILAEKAYLPIYTPSYIHVRKERRENLPELAESHIKPLISSGLSTENILPEFKIAAKK
jgi:hypothetical protein